MKSASFSFARRIHAWLAGALLPLACAANEPAADNPWKQALSFDYNAAAANFKSLHEATPNDTGLTLGYASALLARQPRTQTNIEDAHRLFSAVLDRTPAGARDHISALFLLARVEHDHLAPPRLDSARERYTRLIRDYPGEALADHAAVNLALMTLAERPARAPEEIVAHIEKLLASVKTPGAIRELHWFLANVKWRRLHDASAALPHLQAARLIGCEQPLRNATLDLAIAGIALEAGHSALALTHYRTFLRESPRDVRASSVRTVVASLENASAEKTASVP